MALPIRTPTSTASDARNSERPGTRNAATIGNNSEMPRLNHRTKLSKNAKRRSSDGTGSIPTSGIASGAMRPSLRRHYPDQVQGVGGLNEAALSARSSRAPPLTPLSLEGFRGEQLERGLERGLRECDLR